MRGVRHKRDPSAQAIGRSRGGWTTKVHAFTDVIGRPYVLMLTAGNVSDVKGARATCSSIKAVTQTGCAAHYVMPEPFPSFPVGATRKRAIRSDKLAANFLSGVALATVIAFWL